MHAHLALAMLYYVLEKIRVNVACIVALNAERRADEARGHVRWLRQELQAPNEVRQAARADRAGPGLKCRQQLLARLLGGSKGKPLAGSRGSALAFLLSRDHCRSPQTG